MAPSSAGGACVLTRLPRIGPPAGKLPPGPGTGTGTGLPRVCPGGALGRGLQDQQAGGQRLVFTGCSGGARICPRRDWSLGAGGSQQAGQTPALWASLL